MTARKLATFSCLLVALVFAGQTEAGAEYLFYMRKDLSHLIRKTPKKAEDKQIQVTDELAIDFKGDDSRKADLDGTTYRFFETTYFHCAVPTDKTGAHLDAIVADAKQGYEQVTRSIEEVNEKVRKGELSREAASQERRKLYWELYKIYDNKPIVTIYATVKHADYWGKVKNKGAGVRTEQITLVVDQIKKPRKRWYKSLDE